MALTQVTIPYSYAVRSLGAFVKLPRELRDRIWELATTPDPNREVDITSTCCAHVGLLRTSKQIRAEARKFVGKANAALAECPHKNIVITVPTLEEYPEAQYKDSLIPSLIADTVKPNARYAHSLVGAKKTRFLTGHLGNDVPLAVVVHLDLPFKVSVEVYGASARRDAAVQKDLEYLLESVVERAQKDVRPWTQVNAGLGDLNRVLLERELTNLGQWVREVVLDEIEEDYESGEEAE